MSRGSLRRGVSVAQCLVGIVLTVALGACSPQEAIDAPPASERAAAVVASEAFEEGIMQITDFEVPGPAVGQSIGSPNRVGSAAVPVRLYEPVVPAWAALVWAHGGSFQRGTLDWPEAHWVSQRFADAGVRVYSVDYVLAGASVKAPAPANDVAAVLAWASARESVPVVVGGASAGAHLATEAALAQADLARARHSSLDTDGVESGEAAAALIMQYPTLHRVQRADDEISAATRSLPAERRFDPERIRQMYDIYLGSAADAPAAVGELEASRLSRLPPVIMVNADADDLRASGEEFAEQLAAAGVPVAMALQPGTVHGYLNRPEESEAATAAAIQTIDLFVTEIKRVLAG